MIVPLDVELPANAVERVSAVEIQHAIRQVAGKLNEQFCSMTEPVLMLTVMNGGMVFAGHLIPQLRFPLTCDYLHVSRYGSETKGQPLRWLARPTSSLAGKRVVVIDDILDQGITCLAIKEFCKAQGALQVSLVVLVAKPVQCRSVDIVADIVGLPIADEFVFGVGMDYAGLYRNLPGLYALAPREKN